MKFGLSLLFKLIIFTLAFTGVYLTFVDAGNPFEVISYFTTMVNIFTAISYVLMIANLFVIKQSTRWLVYLKQSLMVYLLLTLIIYSFVLIPYIADNDLNYQIFSLKDILIHYAVPTFVVLDYAWFSTKGQIRPLDILSNLLGIAAYLMYLFVYVSLGGRFTLNGVQTLYPYFFLDIETLGVPMFTIIASAIIAVVILIGWILYQVDYLVSIPLHLTKHKRK